MVVVKIELWPKGDQSQARQIGEARISLVAVASEAEISVNACSRPYGALRRAVVNLGYLRIVTYSLPGEPGTSLKAAGFRDCGETDGGEWSRPSRRRSAVVSTEKKRRWIWP